MEMLANAVVEVIWEDVSVSDQPVIDLKPKQSCTPIMSQ